MKKIVFVVNSITITRCIKRIEEFIDNGYEVEVFGFDRGGEVYAKSAKYNITIIGKHEISQSYWQRLIVIYRSLKKLFKQFKHQNVLFYYFFFDVAFTARLICRSTFIYEESDLPYTGIKNPLVRNILRMIDKRMIKQSLLTIMTSEGFIDYHFGERKPHNIVVVPNRVNPQLVGMEYHGKEIDVNHISFSFVGGFRYNSVLNFADVIANCFPQHSFHVFGTIQEHEEEFKVLCERHNNIQYHGKFKNPTDLPSVYEQTDIVIATYDATYINAQFAEPNKLYEAIFFRTPIIVSSGTYLARKVKVLGIGYDVNALNKESIKELIVSLNTIGIKDKISGLNGIPIQYAINNNSELFDFLKEYTNVVKQ